MATQTTVLDLTKPAGNENALISVINSNMDKVDAEAGKVRGNVAADYSTSSAYAVGALCIYGGNLYSCNTAIGTGGEAWNAAHWTHVTIAGELAGVAAEIPEVVDNLTTTSSTKALSAGQGKTLADQISTLAGKFNKRFYKLMTTNANGIIDLNSDTDWQAFFNPSTMYIVSAIALNLQDYYCVVGYATNQGMPWVKVMKYDNTPLASNSVGLQIYCNVVG